MTPDHNHGYRVLVTDDEEGLRFVLREVLSREGCEVDEARDGEEAVAKARDNGYDLYLLDMKMPRKDGMQAMQEIRLLYPGAMIVMITAHGSQSHAIEALKAGAYDYFSKPFNIEELKIVLMRALEKQRLMRKLNELSAHGTESNKMGRMIGNCMGMQKVFSMVRRIAEHDVTVLITGESGTGKELVSRAIHDASERAEGPFITVNCAAIPEPLLESELFGHEKGSFTGATHARPGKFEAADGGTILLDEIGEMPLSLQAKLLRVLQQHEIERVGSNNTRTVDIRVLAATNRDLAEMVRKGAFREDLYFRINVVPVHLPPLRERREDLAMLIQYFIGQFNARFGKRIEGMTPDAMRAMELHTWPGNVREMENVIQRAMVMTGGHMIGLDALPELIASCIPIRPPAAAPQHDPAANAADNGSTSGLSVEANVQAMFDDSWPNSMAEHIDRIVIGEECKIIMAALDRMNGRRQETADLLGISRKSLHNKMQKYGLFEWERSEG